MPRPRTGWGIFSCASVPILPRRAAYLSPTGERGQKLRNASLEGLRGAAALFVVLFHLHFAMPWIAGVENGYLAVDLFFVLSGYVIAGAYGASVRDASGCMAFIVRRFARLWPAHIAASAALYAFYVLAKLPHGHVITASVPTVTEAAAIATFTQGLNLFDRHIGLEVTWSTGDEFFVYALFGLICLAARGRSRVVAFALLALVGYALAIWASVGPSGCLTLGECFGMTFSYGWSRCLAGFFVGALIAEYRNHAAIAALTGRATQLLTFAAALLFVLFADRVPGSAFAAPVVFAALLASLIRDSGPVARILQTRAAQYLGRLSYSLYLAHAVLRPELFGIAEHVSGALAPVVALLYLFASFALARILYERVETPCRERINAWADRAFSRAPQLPQSVTLIRTPSRPPFQNKSGFGRCPDEHRHVQPPPKTT